MLDSARPILAVDGNPITVLSTTLQGRYPIAYVRTADLDQVVQQATAEGKDSRGRQVLQNEPSIYYVNLYRKPDGLPYVGQPKRTREEAVGSLERNDPASRNVYLKTVQISI